MPLRFVFLLSLWFYWNAAEAQSSQIVLISNDTEAVTGETVIVVCVTDQQTNGLITWNYDGQAISNSPLVTVTEEDVTVNGRDFTQSFLQICSVQESATGAYTCVFSNGSASVNSTTQLIVTAAEAVELVIISNATALSEGETAVLACVGYGVPSVEISWMRDGLTISNTSLVSISEEDVVQGDRLFKQSFLQICSVEIENAGTYTCVVSNGVTSVNSSTQLTVSDAEIVELVIISNATALSVGETALLACVGYGVPSVEISWMRDGLTISNTSLVSISEEDVVQGDRLFKQSFLQICSVEMENAGTYTCVVSNGVTSVNSSTQLTVSDAEIVELVIISNATALSVGETALLACVGYGVPSVEISWMRDGLTISNTSLVSISEEDVVQGDRLFKQSFLQICSVEMENAGTYTCVVSNGVTSVNSSTQLTVSDAEIVELVIISNATALSVGETALLACVGYGVPSVEISWMRDGLTISNTSLVSISEEDVVQGDRLFKQSFLQICSVEMENAGTYTCVVSNGVTSVNSSTQLTVSDAEIVELVIISNATALSVGETALLACVGYGVPSVEISWMRDGLTISNTSLVSISEEDVVQGDRLFKQSFLQICSVEMENAGTYTCVVSNGVTSVNSSTQLTVSDAEIVELVIISNATALSVGETALLACVGYGVPSVEISWMRDGLTISNTSLVSISEEDVVQGDRLFKQSFLQICSVEMENAGTYTCVVSNGVTSVNSSTQLTVSDAEIVELVIISNATALSVGETALLACVGYGVPSVEISWMRDGLTISNTSLVSISEEDVVQGDRLFKQSFLQICSVEMENAGTYTCVVSNGVTSVNSSTQLTVSDAEIVDLVIISNATALSVGETALLACVGYGVPSVEISWMRDGLTISNTSLVSISEEDVVQGDRLFKQSFLQICSVEMENAGTYTCVVSNGVTSVNSSTQLTVSDAEIVELVIISNATALSVGETALLACVGYGVPSVEISWMRDGLTISNTSLVSISEEDVVQGDRLFKQSFLQICSVEMENAGTYTCVVSNGVTSVNSSTQLTVSDAEIVDLVIISNATALSVGETALLACVGYGVPSVEISWMRDGLTISNTSLVSISEEDVVQGDRLFKQSFLQICSVEMENAGTYTCVVSNGVTSVNSSTQLTVSDAEIVELVIISNATALSVGETALLACVGYGVPSVEISWMRDGLTISNTSLVSISEEDVVQGDRLFKQSFLQICSVEMENAGTYTCVVSNGVTSVNSSTQLTVSDAEIVELVIISNATALSVGETALLACVGYGVPSVEISWMRDGLTISNTSLVSISEEDVVQGDRLFKQSFLQICSVEMENAGTYTCVVSNGVTSVNSSTQLTVSDAEIVELVIISNATALSVGETALLACVGYGVPSVEISWMRDGLTISNTSLVSISEEDVVQGDRLFKQSFLQICSVEMENAGTYTCVVSNGVTSVNSSTQLTVSDAEIVELVIISNATALSVGETALLACVGYGVPSVEISWMRDGLTISNTSLVSISEEDVVQGDRLFKQSFLQICSVEMENAGTYTCVVSNGVTSVNSSTQLTVSDAEIVELVIISNATALSVGETALLACVGYGVPSVEISWMRDGLTISNTSLVSISEEDVVQGDRLFKQSFLQICSVEMENAGTYTCVVSNGVTSVNSSTQLTVIGAQAVELVIISNATALSEGETALLACVGYGVPSVEISWMRDGLTISNTSLVSISEEDVVQGDRLFKQSFLQICSVEMENAGTYTCVVSNGVTSVNSSTQLTVSDAEIVELVIISNATALSEGETALLACVGYGVPSVEISWMRDGLTISNTSLVSISEEDVVQGDRFYKQSFLQICSVEMENAGTYTCIVSNGVTSVNSSTQLTVSDAEIVELVIISNATALSVGETALLACVGYGVPSVEISWMRDGLTISNTSLVSISEEDVVQGDRLFKQSFLQICSVEMENAGTYTCVVSNGVTSVNSSTQLTVSAVAVAELVIISNDTFLTERQTALLACVGYGAPYVEISWLASNGRPVMNSSLVSVSEEDVFHGGQLFRQSFLQICSVDVTDSGVYTCTVRNGVTSVNASLELGVSAIDEVELVAISNHTSLTEGETALLACVGYGLPSAQVNWMYQGQLLENSSLVSIFEEDVVQDGKLFRQSILQLCSVETADSGSYVCVVSNGLSSANFSVNLVVTPPQVTVEAENVLDVSRDSGSTITLQCRAYGTPFPSVTWSKGDDLLVSSTKFQIESQTDVDGDSVASIVSALTISSLTARDSGNYSCRAFNNMSSASLRMPYNLVVNPVAIDYCSSQPCQNGGRCTSGPNSFMCACMTGWTGLTCTMKATSPTPPVLTSPPQDTVTSIFGQATFSCVASGYPQPDIQWFRDNTLLSGESGSMLIIGDVSLGDRGFYHCLASNSEGTIISPQAVLNIEGIYQFTVPISLPLPIPTSGPFAAGEIPTSDVLEAISNRVGELNDEAAGQEVGALVIYSLETSGSAVTVSSNDTTGVFMVSVVVTLFDPADASAPPSTELLDQIIALIQKLAAQRLQISDLQVEAASIQRFDGCSVESELVRVAGTVTGNIQWTETSIGMTATAMCPCGLVSVPIQATRVCSGNFGTGGVWMAADMSVCEYDGHSVELCAATNMDQVAMLSEDIARIKALGILIVALSIEEDLENLSGDVEASNRIFDIIDNVQKVPLAEMERSHEEFNTSSMLRGQLDRLLETYPITNTPQLVVRDMFGCSLYPDLGNAVLSFSPALGDTIQLEAAPTPNLTITLPETLVADAGFSTPLSLAFCGYKSESLFVRRDSYLKDSGRGNLQLASGVVSARPATNQRVTDLSENVKMTFVKKQESVGSKCSYWEQSLDGGYGGWSEEGCQLVEENGDEVVCECNHLTNFAVLSDGSPAEAEGSIQRYTMIGAAVALLSAVIVLFCVAFTSELRSSAVGVFLINLCIGLLGLYIMYIISHFTGSSEKACEASSFLFHYFVLVSCFALSMSAFFFGWTPFTGKKQVISYMAAIILNWIFPAVVVFVAFFVSGNGAYYPSDSADFCRPVSEAYWFGLLMVGGLFMLLTIVLLVITPIHAKFGQIQLKASSRVEWYAQYFGLVAFAFFFFVAWGFGLPATHTLTLGHDGRVIFQIVFIVCSACQGVVMVACFCLLSKAVRQTCCCGRIRVSYPLTNASNAGGNGTDENPYAMTESEPGLLYQNPIADEKNFEEPPDLDNVQFDFGGSASDKDTVKEDLGEILEADDETATKL